MDTKEGKELFDGYVAKTKQTRPPGFACPGQAGAIAFAAAITKAGSTASSDIIAALEGMTFPTARGPCTLRKEDHQAIVDINIIGFRPSDAAPGWEVTEFLKLDGKDVVEPAQPGKPFDEAAG